MVHFFMDHIANRFHYGEEVTIDHITDYVHNHEQIYDTFPSSQISQLFHLALEYKHMSGINSILYFPHYEPLDLTVPSWLIDELLIECTTSGLLVLTYLAHHYTRRKSWVRLEFTGKQIETLLRLQEESPSVKDFLDIYLQCKDNRDHLFTRMDWDADNYRGFEAVDTEYMDYMSPGYRGYYYQDYPLVSNTLFDNWESLKGYMVGPPTVNHMIIAMVDSGDLGLLIDYTRGYQLDKSAMCMLLHVVMYDLIFEFEVFFSEPSEWSKDWVYLLWDKTMCIRYLYDTQDIHQHNDVLLEQFREEVHEFNDKLHQFFGRLCSISRLVTARPN